MNRVLIVLLSFLLSISNSHGHQNDNKSFNGEQFAKQYFTAWTASQSINATKADIENYLALLTDDIGHQHFPYDVSDERLANGKMNMRKGMNYYLAAHTEYSAKLVSITTGHDVIILQYDTYAKATHPDNKRTVVIDQRMTEILEIEQGKVSVIRKYSQ